MINIESLKTVAARISEMVQNELLNRTPEQKRNYINGSVAMAIAYALPIGEINGVGQVAASQHYNTTHLETVKQLLSGMSNHLDLEVYTILGYVHSIWLTRYSLVYCPMFLGRSTMSLLCQTKALPTDVCETLRELNVVKDMTTIDCLNQLSSCGQDGLHNYQLTIFTDMAAVLA